MSDDTSRPWGKPAEPAEPAEPAKPADPDEREDGAAPTAAAPATSETPPPAPMPVPAPAPPMPPVPPAMPPQPAFQQPQSPYGAPAPQPQSPYGGGYASQPPYGAVPAPGAPGSGKALAALVCGICAIVFSGTVIVGVVLGVVAIVLASQYVRSFGKDGKATGGKVCGIVGVVLSVLALILYLALGALTFVAINNYANDPSYSYSGSTDTLPPSPGPSADDADDAAVKAAAEQAMDRLSTPDQALLERLAEKADDAFKDITDYTLSEVGVDPLEFATWLATDVSYTVADTDAYAYSDGTGTAFVETRSRMLYVVTGALYDALSAESDQNGKYAGEAKFRATMTGLMPAAMEEAAAATEESYLMLDLEKNGDAWTVDEDSFEEALDQMFGLW